MRRLFKHSHWFILIAGIAVTFWAARYVDQQIERKARDSFVLRVQDVEAAVFRRLRSYEDLLFGVAGLYRASREVPPEAFHVYGDSLNIGERFPALQTINFAQYVPRSELDRFLRDGAGDMQKQQDGDSPSLPNDRDEYMVITRAFPPEMASTLGVDVFQNLARRLPNARDGKSILRRDDYLRNRVLSSGIPLTIPGASFSALAARLGVFKPDKDNRIMFLGTAGIGFYLHNFFREAIPDKLANTLHYRMTNIGRENGTRYERPIPIFDSRSIHTGIDPDHMAPEELLTRHFDIPFGGALFRFDVTERRDVSMEGYEKLLPGTILLGGLLFFGGIALTTRRISTHNALLDEAVNKRTIELQCEINRTKSLEQELAAVTKSERVRIGRELHDDLGQRLTGISVSAEILATELRSIDQKLAAQADALGRATSEAMVQVRSLAHGLMPVAAVPEGLRDALGHLAATISRLSGIRCAFDFDDPVDVTDENVSAHLYRITQEAVNNALRHANARTIDIRLDERNGKVSLSIRDDGCGFDNKHPAFRSGLGLNTITYRASIINYDLEILSLPERGTEIRVTES
ncbi:MAG TPA: histidine kinase [Noviherbaspirillum sp.]|uniref:histidine kinase n=1 Tax=Noviherbaspirillum sp. TaxID=1926288 RepID=UPI002D6F899C|nr:histidine kinase [Noviherbaspirillum sp.]HYD95232.1 histidine kinase [Noviherbaspirillum sp.]